MSGGGGIVGTLERCSGALLAGTVSSCPDDVGFVPPSSDIVLERSTVLPRLLCVVALVACKQPSRDAGPALVDPKDQFHDTTTLVDKQDAGPSGIALDATHVYWTHLGRPLVRRMPRAGGPVETLYEGPGNVGGGWIDVVGDTIFFSEGFTIYKLAKTGGEPSIVGAVSLLPARFTADDSGVYSVAGSVVDHRTGTSISSGSELWDIASDATAIYWLDRDGVWRADKADPTPVRLAKGRFRFGRIALSATDVYWGDAVLQSIFSVPKGGGSPRFIAREWDIATRKLVVEGDIAWLLQSGPTMERIDVKTRTVTLVSFDIPKPGSADSFFDFEATPDKLYIAAGGLSLVGAGPAVVDLTNPNARMPTYRYDGAIVTLPTAMPEKPLTRATDDLYVARVGFHTSSSEFNDPLNATRWIDDFKVAYPALETGALRVRIIAASRPASKAADGRAIEPITDVLARERAQKVEVLVREKLGPRARIEIVIEPAAAEELRISFDEADLMLELSAP